MPLEEILLHSQAKLYPLSKFEFGIAGFMLVSLKKDCKLNTIKDLETPLSGSEVDSNFGQQQ